MKLASLPYLIRSNFIKTTPASKKDEIDAGFIIVVMRNHLEAIRRETDERHDHQTKKRETEKRPRE